MILTQTRSPGTVVNDASNGHVAWSDPDYAKIDDTNYATAVLSSSHTNWLKATNFGFNIPANATILEYKPILSEIKGKTNDGDEVMMALNIIRGGTIYTFTGLVVTINGTEQYLGDYEINNIFTVDEINNSGFGVAVKSIFDATTTIMINHIRISVSYYVPSPTPTFHKRRT